MRFSRRKFVAGIGGVGISSSIGGCLSDDDIRRETDFEPSEIDTDDRPSLGDTDAPVYVTVFEDFSCPSCRQFKMEIFNFIVNQYVESGDVRYLHADWPIPVDEEWSYAIPNAAHEVFDQLGRSAFWSFSGLMYENQDQYSNEVIRESVNAVMEQLDIENNNVIADDVINAAENSHYREKIASDRDLGNEIGVEATPTVFVNSTVVPPTDVESEIEDRL